MPLVWIGIYLLVGGIVLFAPSRRVGGPLHRHARNETILRVLVPGRVRRSASSAGV